MSLFKDQLRYSEEADNTAFSESIEAIANAVMGNRLHNSSGKNEIAVSAIEKVLEYYHFKANKEELPPGIDTLEEQIEYYMRPFGIRNRPVTLESGWYHDAVGAMLGTLKEDGSAVALIPGNISGYKIMNPEAGIEIKLNKKTEELLDKEAVCFYEPLPQKALTVADLLKFMWHQLSVSDIVFYICLSGIFAGMGLLSPLFSKWLFGKVLETESMQVLISLAIFMICFSVSQVCFKAFQTLISSRMGIKQDIAVQAAVMNRIMNLPAAFFKKYSSGELFQITGYIQSLCSTIFSTISMTAIEALFSLIYIGQIFMFAPSLVVPALIITLTTITLSLITTFMQMRITRDSMDTSAKLSGLTHATITGIQKIRLAGAEKRMFSRWANMYAREARLLYNPPAFLKLNDTISLAVSLAGTIILYAIALTTHVSVADYYAFTAAYAMVSAAFTSAASIAVTAADIKPILEIAKPVLEAQPEIHKEKENIVQLNGEIELSHISFRYDESMPHVVEDLSLKISPGEYLAIVGPTGCGKSTLVRLLLGFETPDKGSIFYDKQDMAQIDPESLRRKIGTVLQDGKLFPGDIYSNITITAPQLRLEQAWEAAEIASVADDIRAMPMGMFTIISEGQGGISGGQKQRILIARAIAPKPRILIFDEATSALDNITQKKVSEAIDSLQCTRIVIAHRLSTIQHADRIIYLDQGRIMEEGTYAELIAKDGLFAKLIERQRLDKQDV